jgi:dihydroneopterin aldolase
MSKKPMISHHVASAKSKVRHVFVRDLECMALIGIYDHEKEKAQRIIVNIDLSVQESAAVMDDDISHVVSYEIIAKKVESILAEGHINLVETLWKSRISFRMRAVSVWRLSGGASGSYRPSGSSRGCGRCLSSPWGKMRPCLDRSR